MSLADDKRGIFNTIGAYTSMMQEGDLPQQTDLFSSISSKDDIVPFLLDVLKVVAGTEVLKEAIGGIFTKVLDEAEPKIKKELKKQFIQTNANEPLPNTPNNFVGNGITVPVKTIDITGKFKNSPTSDMGNLIYGTASSSFDKAAYDAILNTPSFVGYKNLQIKYIQSSDSFQIKPSGNTSINIGQWFSDYIDDATIIDKTVIISAVMGVIYGTLNKKQNKTVEQTYEELKVETLLEQVLNDDDSFVISPSKYDKLLTKATELTEGTLNYDMGCGLMPAELGFDDFYKSVTTIAGSNDPYLIGNEFENTINQSTSGSTETADLTEENKQTIKDGFFQKIINVFTVQLLGAVTSAPQIRALFGIMSSLETQGTVLIDKASEDMENFKTCIKCMAKEIMIMVAKFLFVLAVAYLIKLLKPVIVKVLKEKINQYVGVIKSLTGPVGKVAGNLIE